MLCRAEIQSQQMVRRAVLCGLILQKHFSGQVVLESPIKEFQRVPCHPVVTLCRLLGGILSRWMARQGHRVVKFALPDA